MILLDPRDWRKLESAMSEVAAEHGISAEFFDTHHVGPYRIHFADVVDPDAPTVLVFIFSNQTNGKPRVMSLNEAVALVEQWERDAMYEGESGDVG